MKPFRHLSEIEQYTEDPNNRVMGEFRCLMWDEEYRADRSVKTTLWRVAHRPDAGRHPYAVGKFYEHVSC